MSKPLLQPLIPRGSAEDSAAGVVMLGAASAALGGLPAKIMTESCGGVQVCLLTQKEMLLMQTLT